MAADIVKKLLRERHINFSDEWYTECMKWIRANHSSSQVSDRNFLQDELFRQWRDTNLTDMQCKCLPANLCSLKTLTLTGNYCLQVNTIEDIGESSYSQWNKLKKLENENTNVTADNNNETKPTWEPKPRRCLYLTMTDGTQEVFGMEMMTISSLNVQMKPGFKMILKGPVECRRGVMHLKSRNVEVLGGEVDDFAETNAFEKILQIRMDERSKPNTGSTLPRPHYNRPAGSPNVSKKGQKYQSSSQLSVSAKNTQPVSLPSWAPQAPSRTAHTFKNQPTARPSVQEVGALDDGDDDFFMAIDESLLMSQVAQQEQQQSVSSATTLRINTTSSSQGSLSSTPASTSVTADPPVIDIFDDDDDDFLLETSEISSVSAPCTKKVKTASLPPKSPYQYIKVIKDNVNKLHVGQVVSVKACVATLVSNISTNNGQWSLTVNLNDGSGFLEARVDAAILNGIIGFSVAEMKQLKTNPANKAKIPQGLAKLTSTLVHMNGIFEIAIEKPVPVIKTYSEIHQSHVTALKSRLRDC